LAHSAIYELWYIGLLESNRKWAAFDVLTDIECCYWSAERGEVGTPDADRPASAATANTTAEQPKYKPSSLAWAPTCRVENKLMFSIRRRQKYGQKINLAPTDILQLANWR